VGLPKSGNEVAPQAFVHGQRRRLLRVSQLWRGVHQPQNPTETRPAMYVEKALQLGALRWLREQRGYAELLSDEEATGDRVDSVAVMDGRIHLVEVKPAVHAGAVRHCANRPGTIESKIAGVLRALHAKEGDRVSRAALANWNPVRPPVFALLAARYSPDGLYELDELLRARSSEWLFDYRIWRWTGCRVEELERRDLVPPPSPTAYATLSIERLIGRARREPNRTVAELHAMARDRGVGALLDHALGLARELGFRRRPTRSNINLSRRTAGGNWKRSWASTSWARLGISA
jgi:hypothetical protein